jgi:hypothetical protein
MVLAIAALVFQFGAVGQALPDVALAPATPIAKPSLADAKPDQPKPMASSASSTNNSAAGTAGALTAASLDTSSRNSRALSDVEIREPLPDKPIRVIPAESHPRRTWMLLAIAEHSAATFDAYSTREAVSTGATEADPFMRPFAHSPAIYAAIQVGPAILDYAAHRMQRSENSFIRRNWWIPQTASTGMYLVSGVHNMNVASRH